MDEKDHSIRFINSNYDTLFRIPDGGIVEVRFPDRAFSAKCEYLDDYHTMVGDTVFHICEFAEMVERQGGSHWIKQPGSLPIGNIWWSSARTADSDMSF